MKVSVIGGGYVGLVTASSFASLGHDVLCVEKDINKLALLKKNISPIFEPGLSELILEMQVKKRLFFTSNIEEGIQYSPIIFLCVGTPESEAGDADLSQVESVIRDIATHHNGYKLIIEKSTVPVNTFQWIKKSLKRYASALIDFDVASNPEFLREGNAIKDFLNPDRIVVGIESDKAKKLFEELYSYFIKKNTPILFTTPNTAEIIKHASNSFLALKISYINMIADFCEKVDADVEMVAKGIGFDNRIGKSFLNAGIGYGGSCFPKDVKAFIKMAEHEGIHFELLRQVEQINCQRVAFFVNKIKKILWINKDKTIAIWGLAFKPNTDDIREAPAIRIVQHLLKEGAHINLYDPKANHTFQTIFSENEKLHYSDDIYDCVKHADALLILTEWDDFKKADLLTVKQSMKVPIIIDGRNIYDPISVRSLGFEYYGIGRERFNIEDVLA